jgi:hypothetical protein
VKVRRRGGRIPGVLNFRVSRVRFSPILSCLSALIGGRNLFLYAKNGRIEPPMNAD